MNPARFRHRIEIQEFAESVNDNGYPVEGWTTKCYLWADIKTVKGSEMITSATEVNTDTYRFIIRYTRGLHAKLRVVFNGRTFDIQSILNDDELRKTLTVIAIAQNRDEEL